MDALSSTDENLVDFDVETNEQYMKDFTWKIIFRDKTLTW